MSEKKQLNEEELKKVSGGWMEDTDDDLETDEATVTDPVNGVCSEGYAKHGSNARPNH